MQRRRSGVKWKLRAEDIFVGDAQDAAEIRGTLGRREEFAGATEAAAAVHEVPKFVTALEVLVVFAGILAYIWRWHHTAPYVWVVLWAIILVSHVLHRDSLRQLGLSRGGFRLSAQWVWPIAILLYVPMLLYGFEDHRLSLLAPTWRMLAVLIGYGVWCVFQQYLAQSYFNNRLMLVIRNRHLSSVLVGIMFAATHIPNPILVVATFIAGTVFAEIFARYRNIWPLALAQAVGGLLLAAVSPESLIHHMRVGPGYYFYGIR